jgi:hypothetical protein
MFGTINIKSLGTSGRTTASCFSGISSGAGSSKRISTFNKSKMSSTQNIYYSWPGPFKSISSSYYQLLPGTYTFVNGFYIPGGVTVYINPGVTLNISTCNGMSCSNESTWGTIYNDGTFVRVVYNNGNGGLTGPIINGSISPGPQGTGSFCSVVVYSNPPIYSPLPLPGTTCN